MALVTESFAPSVPPVYKKYVEKTCSVVVEEKALTTCFYHRQCLAILLDIFEKSATLSNRDCCNKIEKIAEFVTCGEESRKVFRTFCFMSFVDRYQDSCIIAEAMNKLDDKINNLHWSMFNQLEEECSQLLTRLVTIENLSSLDTELVCLLHTLCKWNPDNPSLQSLLYEIGRSVWPYVNRPLWGSELFTDFISDILQVVGHRLEKSNPKSFKTAWDVIMKNIIGMQDKLSFYSRMQLMAVVDCKQGMWSLPQGLTEYYREQYKEFLESKKKEVSLFLGYLPSRRKRSLTVKPGRSAADFLKRRLSSENLEKEDQSSSSSFDGYDSLSDLNEEVFESEECKDEAVDIAPDMKDIASDIQSDAENVSLVKDLTGLVKAVENCQLNQEPKNGIMADDKISSTEAGSTDTDHESCVLEKKIIIVRVPKEYVGRVIGSHGSMIMTVQEESGAKVHFVKDKPAQAVPNRPAFSINCVKNIVHNTLGFPKVRSEALIENDEKPEPEVDDRPEVSENKDTEMEKEECDFEIIGTEETIRKAKRKIESIISHAKSQETRTRLTRSLSEATPRPSFKLINRSLSCPIEDWGESCSGDCATCRKGCYCRAFLLSQSESPSSWIRPDDLSITRDADWAMLIVKTQVNCHFRRASNESSKSVATSEQGDAVTS